MQYMSRRGVEQPISSAELGVYQLESSAATRIQITQPLVSCFTCSRARRFDSAVRANARATRANIFGPAMLSSSLRSCCNAKPLAGLRRGLRALSTAVI